MLPDTIHRQVFEPSNGHAAATAASPPRPLLIELSEAARLLSVSPRTLWGMTSPRGPVPCVKLGRAVRYRVRDLEEFVDRQRQS